MSIRATLEAPQISTRRWDLLVAGAGPAGALLAKRVAADGLAVLLVDRQSFPRDKVCSGCLSARRPALAAPFVRHLHAGRVAAEGGSWR